VVALEYAVAALPVIQPVILANVPVELARYVAAFEVSVATYDELTAIVEAAEPS
jgi:hypothetical protein